jgi:hypothetical protein
VTNVLDFPVQWTGGCCRIPQYISVLLMRCNCAPWRSRAAPEGSNFRVPVGTAVLI